MVDNRGAVLLGDQRPRISHIPAPVSGSLGREAVDLAKLAGLELDDWQAWVLEHSCSVNPDLEYWNPFTKRLENKWSAFEVAVNVSRQNGKGSIIEARELAGLFLFGERLIIHSAHLFKTSSEAYRRIKQLIIQTPDLMAEVKQMWDANGKEGIELKSGQRLVFAARTKSGGRGLTGDCLFLDEYMILQADAMGALLPTLSARPNPQVWYLGSAGNEESEQQAAVRDRALRGKDRRLFFVEWSIDPCNDDCHDPCADGHDAPDSPESYAKANPGYNVRISHDYIEAEREALDEETFLRERLGVGTYPVKGEAWKVIRRDAWMRRTDYTSELQDPFALGIDVTPDMQWSCLAAAGLSQTGLIHVEIPVRDEQYFHRRGTQWIVPAVVDMCDRLDIDCVAVDTVGPAGDLIDPLEKEGIDVVSSTSREYGQACAAFKAAVMPAKGELPTLVHRGQGILATAIAGADKRKLQDLWLWDKTTSTDDICPLVAATHAVWAFRKHIQGGTADPWVHKA